MKDYLKVALKFCASTSTNSLLSVAFCKDPQILTLTIFSSFFKDDNTLGGERGSSEKRILKARETALLIAATVGTIDVSPTPRTPYG